MRTRAITKKMVVVILVSFFLGILSLNMLPQKEVDFAYNKHNLGRIPEDTPVQGPVITMELMVNNGNRL